MLVTPYSGNFLDRNVNWLEPTLVGHRHEIHQNILYYNRYYAKSWTSYVPISAT